jgi:hypothetical protein
MSSHELVYEPSASLASSSLVPDPDVDVSLATKDKDMSRGMGRLLRNPNRLHPLITRAKATNLGPYVLSFSDDTIISLGPVPHASSRSLSPTQISSDRVLRIRTKRVASTPDPAPGPAAKRPVKDRWFYEPVSVTAGNPALAALHLPPDASITATTVLPPDAPNATTASRTTLKPRAAWMLTDDAVPMLRPTLIRIRHVTSF